MIAWQHDGMAGVDRSDLSHDKCPCCAQPINSASHYVRYPPFVLVQCGSCGFEFVGNPLGPEELEARYANEFATQNAPAYHEMQQQNARINSRQIRRHYRSLTGRSGTGDRALDVGAGFGYLVASLAAMGFDAKGIELSPVQREYGQKQLGATLTSESLEDLQRQGSHFDLITICDVIEHIVQPKGFLQECLGLLKAGGLLIIKTENFEGLAATLMGLHFYRQIPIEHVSLFSPRTLDTMTNALGLKTKKILTWTPGYGMRWAVKFRILQALGRTPPLLEPTTKNQAGPPMSLLGRITNPLFRALAVPVDLAGHGVEFMAFFKKS